ncbi:MAG: DEAD/DEAH box helicase [Flammeovirgaceae bacterium]|nr:DEAD/DEAH box helicase [Flammeovirgaceae bacterium]
MSFKNLEIIEPVLRALEEEGYVKPTPIQERSIPVLLQRKDLLGCAQTGTGKTAAFAIPILQLLHNDELYRKGPAGIKTLILTPTRELAIQIGDSFKAYGKYMRIRHTVIFGGVPQRSQTDALRAGVDILIATPGRLLDLINQRYVRLEHIRMLVLDEADRMLDMGFIHDVKKIIAKVPTKRQTIFFSATMPTEIASLANTILSNPVRVEVTPASSTANTVRQELYYVDKGNKKKLLLDLLTDTSINTALVFTRTKHGADRVAKDLNKAGISAEAIHGNKSQNARQRALKNFKLQKTRVLVATDIAARGIDIDELSHVINFELPNVPETYVHRIGRTGRAGASGISISFCDAEEKAYVKDIHKLIGKTIPVVENHAYPLVNHSVLPKEKQRPSSTRNAGRKNDFRNSKRKRYHQKAGRN